MNVRLRIQTTTLQKTDDTAHKPARLPATLRDTQGSTGAKEKDDNGIAIATILSLVIVLG